jgi:hypothetical protein
MLSDGLINELRGIVGDDGVHAGPAERLAYSYDGTFQQHLPDIAVSPRSTEEVSQVVQLANNEGLPIVSRGAGTSLTGGTIPVGGGIVLNLARMNRIIEIDTVNTVAVVEAGFAAQRELHPGAVGRGFDGFGEEAVLSERLVEGVDGEGVIDEVQPGSRDPGQDERVQVVEAPDRGEPEFTAFRGGGVDPAEVLETVAVLDVSVHRQRVRRPSSPFLRRARADRGKAEQADRSAQCGSSLHASFLGG